MQALLCTNHFVRCRGDNKRAKITALGLRCMELSESRYTAQQWWERRGCLPCGSGPIIAVFETSSWGQRQFFPLNLHFKKATESYLEMEWFFFPSVVLMQTHAHKIGGELWWEAAYHFPVSTWHRIFRKFSAVKWEQWMSVSLLYKGESGGSGLVDRTHSMDLHISIGSILPPGFSVTCWVSLARVQCLSSISAQSNAFGSIAGLHHCPLK